LDSQSNTSSLSHPEVPQLPLFLHPAGTPVSGFGVLQLLQLMATNYDKKTTSTLSECTVDVQA
jgi:hypothetical protein